MSLIGFEGCAGTGKTTRLRLAAIGHLSKNQLKDDERVLALTKMHGSRRRMLTALTGPHGLDARVDCLTIDSFAWGLVRRWRSLLRQEGMEFPEEEDWSAVTAAAAEILKADSVASWVACRYPVVVVDELQDCRKGEVDILKTLGGVSAVFCAADEFQDLFGGEDNEAIRWSRDAGDITTLREVHRTHESALREAATALRTGRDLPLGQERGPFYVLSAPTFSIGAGRLAWMLKYSWSKPGSSVAVLSTTRSENSPFVKKLLERLAEKPFFSKKGDKSTGPYRIWWEVGEEDEEGQLLDKLDLPARGSESVTTQQIAEAARVAQIKDLLEWADRRVKLGYNETLTGEQVAETVKSLVRRRRAFGATRQRHRAAMTIYQAKNREFDYVVILWPMQVKDDTLHLRRLLYNAITRARRAALVIVQDPKRNRLQKPPFRAG